MNQPCLQWLESTSRIQKDDFIDQCVQSFSASEMGDLVLILEAVSVDFIRWGELAEGSENASVLFVVNGLRVARMFLSPSEIKAEEFHRELMLAILGFRATHLSEREFDESIARGYLVERILSRGIDVAKISDSYLRWLDANKTALSQYSSMLRTRKRLTPDYLEELLVSGCPVSLSDGTL